MLALGGLLVCVFVATASGQSPVDSLECTPEEYAAAQSTMPSNRLRMLYQPFLTQPPSSFSDIFNSKSQMKWYVECITENKACSRLGKAMQYFVTDPSGKSWLDGNACMSRRLRVLLREAYCNHSTMAKKIQTHIYSIRQFDVFDYYLGNPITCSKKE